MNLPSLVMEITIFRGENSSFVQPKGKPKLLHLLHLGRLFANGAFRLGI
jgi:hypothetical protein